MRTEIVVPQISADRANAFENIKRAHGIVGGQPILPHLDLVPISKKTAPPPYVHVPAMGSLEICAAMQALVDDMQPALATECTEWDNLALENSDLTVGVENCRIDLSCTGRGAERTEKLPALVPRLRTGHPIV